MITPELYLVGDSSAFLVRNIMYGEVMLLNTQLMYGTLEVPLEMTL